VKTKGAVSLLYYLSLFTEVLKVSLRMYATGLPPARRRQFGWWPIVEGITIHSAAIQKDLRLELWPACGSS
jgi:hypothetical protein